MIKSNKVILITGPTASGKTSVSLRTAMKLNGEIVCADSMQVYKDMNIGTAKATFEEKKLIKHHMLDIISPEEKYSVAAYKEDATRTIRNIQAKGKIPVVCGGTGQYISALMQGTDFIEIKTDYTLRKKLESEYDIKGAEYFYSLLEKTDPESALKIHRNDKKRILRALEIKTLTGHTKSYYDKKSREKGPDFDFSGYCIYHDREILYRRINQRVDKMMSDGLLDEVIFLIKKYPDMSKTAVQAIGYKEIIDYIEGKSSLDESIEKIKQLSRNYAKRQLTWFRKTDNLTWLENSDESLTVSIISENFTGLS